MERTLHLWLALASLVLSGALQAEPYKANFDPGYRPELSSDEGGFWYQVDKIEESVKVSPDLVTDPALNQYVKDLTCKLAGDYCPHIRVYILRSPHFNAGMYPNGMMHVWSGLLLRVDSEAELAAVLSHEIAHFLRSHQITQWRSLRSKASAAIFADMILTMGLASLSVASGAMAFSREQETEADLYGLQLMTHSGYAPEKASALWEYVYQESEQDKSKEKHSTFFASHPKSKDRMTLLSKKATEINASGKTFKTNSAEYLKVVSPLYIEFMNSHLSLQDLGRTEAMLERHTRMGYPKGTVEFFKGELCKLRKGTNDETQAMQHYRNSVTEAQHPPEAHRELGYLLVKTDPKAAKQHLENYLALAPAASDKEMVQFYIDSANQ
ncbi:MAG TPA: M48 family metallopeptidase [Cellvibrio sp.]|nr:M48 family metallopeptidase [Cellvibrio sp.]